jgi:outer membrane protein assembly factor BamB
MKLRRAILPAAALAWACGAEGFAQEWTRFRGPNGSGVSEAATVPAKWEAGDVNWETRLPGAGHSSPVVWGDRIFLTSADEAKGERYLLCLDAKDGRERWRQAFGFAKHPKHKNNTYATSTPAVDADRVVVLWQSPQESALHALDLEGKPLWRHDLGGYKGNHGGGTSPVLHAGVVLLANDTDGESFLLALDAATGKVRWKVPRIGDRACYATPCILERPGREPEVVFTHSYRGITGVDLRTGRKLWEIDVFGTHEQRAIGSPVVFGDLVIGTSGFAASEKNVVAVRPDGDSAKEVYRLQRQVPHIPTPLVYKGRLFLWSDAGIVTCADAATGNVLWQERVGGTYYGSPVCVGGKLFAVDQTGQVTVVAASDRFEVLARNPLKETARSTPAVSGGVLYVRTETRLVSVGGRR